MYRIELKARMGNIKLRKWGINTKSQSIKYINIEIQIQYT